MAGRPSKLNEKLIEDMYKVVREGLPLRYAADMFSVTANSLYNWMNKGETDIANEVDSLEAEFFDTIKKAQAEYVYETSIDIRSGKPGWQGAAWWLERTRQDFMPKQEVVAEEGKVQVVIGGKVKEVKRNDSISR